MTTLLFVHISMDFTGVYTLTTTAVTTSHVIILSLQKVHIGSSVGTNF